MVKKILLVIFFLVFIIANGKKQGRVCFENNCFRVELAKTPAEKSRGLMFRKNLGRDRGMLFIFSREGRYSFWMKNTLIPLDMIWLSQDGQVVFIAEKNQPCEKEACLAIRPDKDAKYVLEINGGRARAIGVKAGDLAKIF